jgi:glycosyltransferase involved in cell wall biosynthesis
MPFKHKKYAFENKLIRYIKINKKQIKIKDYEQKLFNAIKYVNSLKESKHEISYKEIKKPKVSFISTVFNQENYLSNFIFSVQSQKLREYELIFVDDSSADNGTKIINKIKEKDERIKLIKNKKNMGALYSRYIGELNSNSKYIIFIDCDDFVLENGIFNSYKYIKKNNIDIVQFHAIWQDKNRISIRNFSYYYEKIIYQPYLSYIYYYNIKTKKGDESNYALWNKLIKRKIVNKAFKWIGEKYLKEKIIIHNDLIILFSLLKNAKSYKYIDELGYYYYKSNKNSASSSWKNYKISNELIHGLFTNIKFLFEKTGNTFLDKYFCIFKVQNYYNQYNKLFKYLNNKELNYITKIFNTLIRSDFISKEDKANILATKILIFKRVETQED